MKKKCAVCQRERDISTMIEMSPSFSEKEALKKMGEENPLSSYFYCKPCVKILSNPATAIPLMQGFVQIQARAAGVPMQSAALIADKFGKKVLSATPKKQPS